MRMTREGIRVCVILEDDILGVGLLAVIYKLDGQIVIFPLQCNSLTLGYVVAAVAVLASNCRIKDVQVSSHIL